MIPFSPPRMDEKITQAVVEALNSGWITTGPKTKLFEKKLTEYCGCKTTLCVNSASGGLELVLRWFGVGPGDEVILPAYTYAATANVIIHTGAKPVFVDVANDFNIDIQNIKKKINKKTKVIMPVDIGGWPCDYEKINDLVKSPEIMSLFSPNSDEQQKLGRILILSDAAHSLGAEIEGNKTGSLTDITVFSFHAVKNLTTAEGGAIALNLPQQFDNEELYTQFNRKSLHGQSKDALAKTQIGNWKYDILEAGYKLNMTDIQAAMGLVELERYENDMLIRRKEIFDAYSEAFGDEEWALIPEYKTGEKTSSFHLYLLRINGISEDQRNEIIQEIFNREVSVNVHYIPLPSMTFYKGLGYKIEDYPNTFNLYQNEISLPVYYSLSNEEVKTVIKAVKDSVNKITNK
jgi:dTDP-4-amino-4,6-dideoxygalactose transaminase